MAFALLLAPVTVAQQSGDISQYLKAGHPDVYTVVKGDTLWDISGRFLEKEWLWPEIWQINPQVANPHLIYPGDEIALVYVEGQPRLQLNRGVAGRTVKMTPTDTLSLSPTIRSEPLETAIPAISLDAIQGFLIDNRIVEPGLISAAPYILQGEAERLILGAGDRLYARGVLEDNESYSFVRNGPLYVDPQTKEVLGQEATYIGMGKSVSQTDDVATLSVISTREEVQIGDRLLPTEERKVSSTFFPSAPSSEIEGEILAVMGGVTQVGQYDVVVVNRGEREGLEAGNVLAIYRRGAMVRDRVANESIRLPSERAGVLMIFRVFEKLSYGLVMVTERPLAVNDEVKNP
ncbi:MAG: LysM peptidoglycan-binding domain-containing protein [Proteobacteria bacterium]|nr:LysM peptidoglycan-binding domain-containing protein [Pseudomonadota bacterium]